MFIFVALFLDILLGDPKYIPHPVEWLGGSAHFLEKILRDRTGESDHRRGREKIQGGIFCAAVLVTTVLVITLFLWAVSFIDLLFPAAIAYLLYAALAWRSLKDHSLPVAAALFKGDLESARKDLSYIVGRDTQNLTEEDIVRATVETIGENFIDGVASVLFYMALGYGAGYALGHGELFSGAFAALLAWLFKAASTLDSMVGYNDERYRDFGCVSARLDDVLNFVPARLGACIVLLAGACRGYPFRRALSVFLRDRKKHKSPNSAHGESAFSGLMGIRLGGGASYGEVFEERPFIGEALREPEPFDILRAQTILDASTALFALMILIILYALK